MNNVLWIVDTALGQMRDLASAHAPLETGGMLLGYDADGSQAVVTGIVGPGQNARHSRFRFRPDYDYQQQQLETRFARAHGRETYLGDWHTHPSGAGALSWLDQRVLLRIAKTPSSGTTSPVMVVLADGDPVWDLHASRLIGFRRGFPGKANLQKLRPQVFVGSANDVRGRSGLNTASSTSG